MGSSGTGSFGNYQPTETDKCEESISAELEEVVREEYFTEHSGAPEVGTKVRLRAKTMNGRFVVETTKASESVGLLPTTLHYLVLCLKKGYSYSGHVSAVRGKKAPVVTVDLVGKKQ